MHHSAGPIAEHLVGLDIALEYRSRAYRMLAKSSSGEVMET